MVAVAGDLSSLLLREKTLRGAIGWSVGEQPASIGKVGKTEETPDANLRPQHMIPHGHTHTYIHI